MPSRSFAWIACAALTWTSSATAHISLESGGTHRSRYGDAQIKDEPCGLAGGGRGSNVYTYAPGETITVSVSEYIPHPSYYRIAFDADGDDDFVDPVSILPIDPSRACPFNAADQCHASDFYNTPAVLPGMDNLEPHVTASFGQIFTFQVTLPDVECDNCTLQIIQVMEDTVHGAFNTQPGHPADLPYIEDVYHQCIDLVLRAPSDTTPPPPAGGAAGAIGAGGAGATPAAGGSGARPSSGGTPTVGTGSSGGAGGTVVSGSGAAGATMVSGADGGPTADETTTLGGSAAGCACRAGKPQEGTPGGAALALGLALTALRRRRRR